MGSYPPAPPPPGNAYQPQFPPPRIPSSGIGAGTIIAIVLGILLLVGFLVSPLFHGIFTGMGGMPVSPFGMGSGATGTWVGLVTISDDMMDHKDRTAAVEVKMSAGGMAPGMTLVMTGKMTEEGHPEEVKIHGSQITAMQGAGINGVLDSSTEAAWNQCFVTGSIVHGLMNFGLQGMSSGNASLKGVLHKGTDADYDALAQKVTSGQAAGGVAKTTEEETKPPGETEHAITKTAAGLATTFIQQVESKDFIDTYESTGNMSPAQQKAATASMDGLSAKVEADEKDQNIYVLGDLYLSMSMTTYGMLRFEHYQDQHTHAADRHDPTESADAQANACKSLAQEAVSKGSFHWHKVDGAYCLDVPADTDREQAVTRMKAFLELHK